MNHTNPNRIPFGLVLLGIMLAGFAGILAAVLIIAAERKPAPPKITTHTVPHRVIGAHQDSIDVRYALKDIQEVQGE